MLRIGARGETGDAADSLRVKCNVEFDVLHGKEQLGGVHGCSHLTELVGLLPTVAVQTFAGLRREIEGVEKPFQLDRCHALETRGDTVRRYYPKWYRGAA